LVGRYERSLVWPCVLVLCIRALAYVVFFESVIALERGDDVVAWMWLWSCLVSRIRCGLCLYGKTSYCHDREVLVDEW